MQEKIYFMPGRNRRLEEGLGILLYQLGFTLHGRESIGAFSKLWFSDQLEFIKQDLEEFWSKDARLIGVSYGAYLLLHALAELEPFPGKILCISPVLGSTSDSDKLLFVRPPRGEKLLQLSEAGQFPNPWFLEIHTGAQDGGCAPELATQFCSFITDTELHIVPESGHHLDSKYVRRMVEKFLLT